MLLVPARAIEAARGPGSCGLDGSCHHQMLTHLLVGPLCVSAPHLQRTTVSEARAQVQQRRNPGSL